MIPLEEAAFPNEGLSEHHILIIPKGERLHRYGLKLQGLVGSKLCERNQNTLYDNTKTSLGFLITV